ncbi:MAG TPA: hypothetical protein VM121_06295 [Acidimicrobiales bacterium]|nr:hypothetical protein [Acidimicrobiales bacterium]
MNERRAEFISYGVACVILVVGGAIFRTPILNWINGPAIVIATVCLLTPWLMKRGRGKDPE